MTTTANLQMTQQRRAILDALSKLASHPTADELYRIVRRRLPRISLGTVYRNLDILTRRGIIGRLPTASAQGRFDGDTRDHYHVRCVDCSQVADVPVEPQARLEAAVRGNSEYEIIGHQLEFVGRCPACRRKQRRKGAGRAR